jgi:hypothetical protein
MEHDVYAQQRVVTRERTVEEATYATKFMVCNQACVSYLEGKRMTDITFKTYDTAQFWLEDWYTIEDLEQLIKDLKAVKERQDKALLQSMKESGVMR